MNNTPNKPIPEFVKGISTLILSLLFVTVAAWIFTYVQKKQGVVTQTVSTHTASTTPSDYDAKNTMEKVTVISDFKNTVVNNVPSVKVSKTLKVQGSFASGYLYVKADVSGKALQIQDPANYDAVFASLVELTLNGKDVEFGGHLIQGRSLDTPAHDTYTELLYKLSDVVYKKKFTDPDTEVFSGNWLEVINDKSTREKIVSFSSTVKGVGNIQELSIYYQCAEGSTCSISAE